MYLYDTMRMLFTPSTTVLAASFSLHAPLATTTVVYPVKLPLVAGGIRTAVLVARSFARQPRQAPQPPLPTSTSSSLSSEYNDSETYCDCLLAVTSFVLLIIHIYIYIYY